MDYEENYHPPDKPGERPILPLEDEPKVEPDEIEPDIVEEPAEVYAAEPVYLAPSPGPNPLILSLIIAFVFILGLAIGFLGRPALLKDLPIEVVVTVVPNESQVIAQASTPAESNEETISEAESSTQSDTAAAGPPTPTIMDFVLSDARHIQGEEAAPITIVEFSDFN